MKLEYKSVNGQLSYCNINVKGNLVIVTELRSNPGVSITNAAEIIAEKVCKNFKIKPEELIYIEHYQSEKSFLRTTDTFDFVEFDINNGKFSEPKWIPIDF